MGLSKFTDIAETMLKCYIFYHESKPSRDWTDEITLLQNSLAAERQKVKELEEELRLEKRKSEQYWVILHKEEHYFYDNEGNLMKHEDLEPEEEEFEEVQK